MAAAAEIRAPEADDHVLSIKRVVHLPVPHVILMPACGARRNVGVTGVVGLAVVILDPVFIQAGHVPVVAEELSNRRVRAHVGNGLRDIAGVVGVAEGLVLIFSGADAVPFKQHAVGGVVADGDGQRDDVGVVQRAYPIGLGRCRQRRHRQQSGSHNQRQQQGCPSLHAMSHCVSFLSAPQGQRRKSFIFCRGRNVSSLRGDRHADGNGSGRGIMRGFQGTGLAGGQRLDPQMQAPWRFFVIFHFFIIFRRP